jgi:hypothetical protein
MKKSRPKATAKKKDGVVRGRCSTVYEDVKGRTFRMKADGDGHNNKSRIKITQV